MMMIALFGIILFRQHFPGVVKADKGKANNDKSLYDNLSLL